MSVGWLVHWLVGSFVCHNQEVTLLCSNRSTILSALPFCLYLGWHLPLPSWWGREADVILKSNAYCYWPHLSFDLLSLSLSLSLFEYKTLLLFISNFFLWYVESQITTNKLCLCSLPRIISFVDYKYSFYDCRKISKALLQQCLTIQMIVGKNPFLFYIYLNLQNIHVKQSIYFLFLLREKTT